MAVGLILSKIFSYILHHAATATMKGDDEKRIHVIVCSVKKARNYFIESKPIQQHDYETPAFTSDIVNLEITSTLPLLS